MRAAAGQRGRLTTAQLVERSWRSLGGDAWLGPEERANAERYLRLLDELEAEGGVAPEQLDKRLKTLYAEAAATPGAVDLMTIHGAKGLEWDVVIVPSLERRGQTTRGRLLSWLELDSADAESAHVVLAPILGKGEASRDLNAWLNGMAVEREAAERKRLLYVACTRAREELHLFASPEATAKGEIGVAADSLLKAAWPAAEEHFRVRPVLRMPTIEPVEEKLALAAAAEEPSLLRRLPAEFDFVGRLAGTPLEHEAEEHEAGSMTFERPEGDFAARAFGNAVHAFLEALAGRVASGDSFDGLLREMPRWTQRISSVLRGDGLPPAMVERLTERVIAGLESTLRDETGRWVLAAHRDAASERALTAWRERRASVRLDRVFRAGPEPGAAGEGCLWVVDFKTAVPGRAGLDEFLLAERERYAPQMAAYARVMGEGEVRMMLYYPMVPAMTWWVAGG
jgi:ATP-dependent exoDNAse (exonuclease V) beta subunit